jgi:hypothetical protein
VRLPVAGGDALHGGAQDHRVAAGLKAERQMGALVYDQEALGLDAGVGSKGKEVLLLVLDLPAGESMTLSVVLYTRPSPACRESGP